MKRSKMKRTIETMEVPLLLAGQRTEWGYTGTHSIRKEAAPQRQAFAQAYFFWSHKWIKTAWSYWSPQDCSSHLWYLFALLSTQSSSLAHPYGAPDIANSGSAVTARKPQQTSSLVPPHCLIKLHLQRHRCGSSSNKQISSKHLSHSSHFWILTLLISYIILALSGRHTLHLPVGYLTPCKLRSFFPKSLYYYQHYLNQVLLYWYVCQIRWHSFNLISSTHSICFNSLTWIPFSTHGHFCSAQLCQK